MLAVAGGLNRKMGGRGYDLFGSRGGLNGFPPVEKFNDEGRRRMIYAHKVRMEKDIVFGAFDCPDAGQSMARRRQSTTPIQALNLFNSQFSIDQAAALADRIQAEAGSDPARQICDMFPQMSSPSCCLWYEQKAWRCFAGQCSIPMSFSLSPEVFLP
jgi:hypothetical protein